MTTIAAERGARSARWTLALCFCAALTDGFDVQSMGVAAPRLAPALALSHDQLGPVFSASTLGLLIGALVLGRLADRVGRKRVLILSLAIFGLFSVATALAWDLGSLLTIRVLAGLGLGGAMPNLVALAAETAPEDRRARVVTLTVAGFPFGGALAGAAAVVLGWKGIFLLGGATPLILAPVMALALPESSRFLAERAIRAAGDLGRDRLLWILFGGRRAASTLLLWTALFAALLTLYLLLNWLPTLMVDRGVNKPTASLVSLLFSLGGGLSALVLSTAIDRRGRAWTLGAVFAGLAVSLVALASVKADLTWVLAAGFSLGVFVSTPPLILYALAPGYYAVAMRGAGVGAAMAVGRLGAIAGPLLAAPLLAAGLGASNILLALLPLVVLAAAATLLLQRRPTVAT